MNDVRSRRRAIKWVPGFALVGMVLGAGCLGDSSERPEPIGTDAQSVHLAGLFEIDGNALTEAAAPGDDWDAVFNGGGSAFAKTFVADPAPLSIFTGGGSKDIHDVTSWKHRSGSVPDKDDITNAYAAAYTDGGDLLLYFGADRLANNGDATFGFWFFKNQIGLNSDGSFSGQHAVGDILAVSDFTKGGAVGTINVYQWVGSGGSHGSLDFVDGGPVLGGPPGTNFFCLPDDLACASVNQQDETAPWPYTPKFGTAGTFPTGSFFEGGINASQLVPGNTCFSSFLAGSRASTEPNSVLKDFALGNFDTCGISVTKTCEVVSLNPPGSDKTFTASFTATVQNTGAAALPTGTVITIVDDAGTPADTSDDIEQSTTLLAPLASGASFVFSPSSFQTDDNPPMNTVTATAEFDSVTVVAEPFSVECAPLALNPEISGEKSCLTKLENKDGHVVVVVEFGGQVCNDGDVPLTIGVEDDKAATVDVVSTSLSPGDCTAFSGSYYPDTANGGILVPGSAMFSDTVTISASNTELGISLDPLMRTATCPLCPACP